MSATPSLRTPTQLVLKTLTVHIITAANIAYFGSLQRRTSRGWLPATRLIFFLLVPPLIIVEICVCIVRAMINFVRDAVDEESTDSLLDVCAALGMHASRLKADDLDTGKQKATSVSLLEVDRTITDRKARPISWAWLGQILISVFTLVQAVGSIVMWGRRIDRGRGYCFAFDTRNALLSMMSCAAGIESIAILLLRSDWTLAQTLPPGAETSRRWQQTQMLLYAWTSLIIHRVIYRASVSDELVGVWRFCTPSGLTMELIGVIHDQLHWQTMLLVVFIVIFRAEILRSIRLWTGARLLNRSMTDKRWRRLVALVHQLLFVWFAFDTVFSLVVDVLEVVVGSYHGNWNAYGDEWWWQDPFSDAIPVL